MGLIGFSLLNEDTNISLIEKACEWLEKHVAEYMSDEYLFPEDLIREFKKAMLKTI